MCNVILTGGDLYSYQEINVGHTYNFQNVHLQYNSSLNQGGFQNKIVAKFSMASGSKSNVERIQGKNQTQNLDPFLVKDVDLNGVIQVIQSNEEKLQIEDLNQQAFLQLCRENDNKLGTLINSLDITMLVYIVECCKISTSDGKMIISSYYCLDGNLNMLQIYLHDPKFFYVPKFLPQISQCIMAENLKYLQPHSSKQAHILQTTFNAQFTRKIPFHLHNSALMKCSRLKGRDKDSDPKFTFEANSKIDLMEKIFDIKAQKYFKKAKK